MWENLRPKFGFAKRISKHRVWIEKLVSDLLVLWYIKGKKAPLEVEEKKVVEIQFVAVTIRPILLQ